MSRTKPYRSVVKVLKKNGWELDHTTGSHEIYIKNGGGLLWMKLREF